MIVELLGGLAWSAFGFIGGYLAAHYKIRLDRLEAKGRKAMDETDPDPRKEGSSHGGTGGPGGIGGVGGQGGGPGGQGGVGGHGGEGSKGLPRWVGVVLILLALATVIQGYYFNRQQNTGSEQNQRVTECQARFNQDFASVLELRSRWANEDRAGLNVMLATVLAGESPAVRRQALVDYLAAVKANDEKRAATPLPDLAHRKCETRVQTGPK
jgi:hypothetical protein